MERLIFINRMRFSGWVIGMFLFGLAIVVGASFIPEGGAYVAWLGWLWMGVAIIVAVAVLSAGRRQIASVTLDGNHQLIVEANGLFGRGRRQHMPLAEVANWRWLSQASNSRGIGPKLFMLAFDFAGKTYRLPVTTAQQIDLDAFRGLAPAVVDDLVPRMPPLRPSQLPRKS